MNYCVHQVDGETFTYKSFIRFVAHVSHRDFIELNYHEHDTATGNSSQPAGEEERKEREKERKEKNNNNNNAKTTTMDENIASTTICWNNTHYSQATRRKLTHTQQQQQGRIKRNIKLGAGTWKHKMSWKRGDTIHIRLPYLRRRRRRHCRSRSARYTHTHRLIDSSAYRDR